MAIGQHGIRELKCLVAGVQSWVLLRLSWKRVDGIYTSMWRVEASARAHFITLHDIRLLVWLWLLPLDRRLSYCG